MPTIVMGKSLKPEQSKSFTPTAAGSVITPDAGYTLSQVTVNGDADLVSANIKSGANIFGVAGNSNVVDTSAGDATAAQILSGKKAYVDGALVTGTIPSKGAATYTPGTSNQTIAAGQYLSGAQTISGDADLVTGNIKAGANIFGVAGKASVVDTSDANAVAGNILSGKTAYVNGSKITGTIASKGAQTYTPGTSNQTISAGQYLSGAQTIAGDPDLVAGNIVAGVNIFGVAGAYPVYTAGNNIIAASDAGAQQYEAVWEKKKEIRLNKAGTYRISFRLSPGQYEAVLGRIYKNGAPYGTQREVPSYNSGGEATTFTQDLAFAANDFVQLYIRPKAVNYWVACGDFRVMVAQNFYLPSVII